MSPPQAPAGDWAEDVDDADVQLISQLPVNPLIKDSELDDGTTTQTIVISAGAVIVGNAAGLTVIVLDTGASALPHASVAAHVSVTTPPQTPGIAESVEVADPLIEQGELNPLL